MSAQLEMFAQTGHGTFVATIGQGSHRNSRDAYRSLGRKRSERLNKVLDYLRANGPCTDREIMAGLNFSDPNCVRPRISEGIAGGLIRETGERICPITNKAVRVVVAI